MARTWFSYIVLAIGLTMLFASDRVTTADDEKVEKEIQIFVDRQGDEDSNVKININGKEADFTLPKLADGETKTITLADGTEVIVKALSGGNKIWIDGEQLDLPVINLDGNSEGLHSIITRVHPAMKFGPHSNAVVISADVPEDAMQAIKGAVNDVLVSYGIEKPVVVQKAPKMEFISVDGTGKVMTIDHKGLDGEAIELLEGHDIDVKVINGKDAVHKIEVIKKEVKDKKDN